MMDKRRKRLALPHFVRSLTFLGLLAFLPSANADGAIELQMLSNEEPELCNAILREAEIALAQGQTTCGFPPNIPSIGLRTIQWIPVEFSAASEDILPTLPIASIDSYLLVRKAMRKDPSLSFAAAKEKIWKEYGENVVSPLKERSGAIESTTIDVDNDGKEEKVYRVVMPGYQLPAKEGQPSEPWSVSMCASETSQPSPLTFLTFEADAKQRMGLLEGSLGDLFIYRNRVWTSQASGGGGIVIFENDVLPSDHTAYQRQICFFNP